MSRIFVVYKHSHLYAFTEHKWLVKLFLLDRNEDSYRIKILKLNKIKNNEFESLYGEHQIHYFYGYAVLQQEIDFVEYMTKNYYDLRLMRELYSPYISKLKKFKKFNREELVPRYIQDMINYAITHPGDVYDKLQQKQFLDSMKGSEL